MELATAPQLRLSLDAAWADTETADAWFAALHAELAWQQEQIRLFGRDVTVPRLTAWVADEGITYTYSGLTHEPAPWTPTIAAIRAGLLETTGIDFNGVLLNRYRDGEDSMGWHADDEPELGPAPTIASVSLGATRAFQLKHRTRKDVARVDLDLTHGSLLVMHPPTQAHWLHQVPKRRGRNAPGERINLTFRRIES